MNDRLVIPKRLWQDVWDGLRVRCAGEHEAACVLGGQRSPGHVRASSVIFLDDLPGVRSARLYHQTPPEATAELFRLLRGRGECVAVDIHAHPEAWVGQSLADQAHPIEFRVGLIALILPWFAQGEPDVSVIGSHEYCGDQRWRAWPAYETRDRITIEEP